MFAICIDAFSASRQLSSDLSEAKLFIALLKVLTVFLCSELCSLIVFASSSISPDREREFLPLTQLAMCAIGNYGQLRLSARHCLPTKIYHILECQASPYEITRSRAVTNIFIYKRRN